MSILNSKLLEFTFYLFQFTGHNGVDGPAKNFMNLIDYILVGLRKSKFRVKISC